MALRTPPPQIPVIKWDSPNKTDLGLIEFWNTEVASYIRIDVGQPHPNTRDYLGYRLGIQSPVEGDEKWMRRVWITDNTNQDWFNYQLKYDAESNGFPIFIRQYQERRDSYTPRTKLSPLQVVYKLLLTNSGSGYDPSLKELPLTFSAGAAAGRALISPDGTISYLVLDNEGSGYSTAPTFTIPAPTAGVTAAGTAYIPPPTALLVKEEAQLYPEDNENYALYFNVLRVYQILPGPFIVDDLYRGPGITVDPETLCLEVTKKRLNVPANILEYASVYTGASGTVTAALTGDVVSSLAITAAGTDYAEYVNLRFSDPAAGGRRASGYVITVSGALTTVVLTDPGDGYVSAPTVDVLPSALVANERKDIDSCTAWEVQKITTDSPFNGYDNAITSDSPDSYPWPGLLDVTSIQTTDLPNVGYVPKQSRRIDLTTHRYWVNSPTEPTPPSWDQIIEDPSCMVGKAAGWGTSLPIIGNYSMVLHDGYIILFTNDNSTNITATYAATTPTLTVWRTWVGTVKKILPPKVTPEKTANRWMIEEYTATIPQLEYLTLS